MKWTAATSITGSTISEDNLRSSNSSTSWDRRAISDCLLAAPLLSTLWPAFCANVWRVPFLGANATLVKRHVDQRARRHVGDVRLWHNADQLIAAPMSASDPKRMRRAGSGPWQRSHQLGANSCTAAVSGGPGGAN